MWLWRAPGGERRGSHLCFADWLTPRSITSASRGGVASSRTAGWPGTPCARCDSCRFSASLGAYMIVGYPLGAFDFQDLTGDLDTDGDVDLDN